MGFVTSKKVVGGMSAADNEVGSGMGCDLNSAVVWWRFAAEGGGRWRSVRVERRRRERGEEAI